MGFLPKKWLRALWGVNQPATQLAPPIDCERCRIARQSGVDACPEHRHHLRPHLYRMGHEVQWGGVFDHPLETVPRTSVETIEEASRPSIHSIH
ncbi:MAG: hypothetical protein ACXVEF_37270 [Polyangiales bacterium]